MHILPMIMIKSLPDIEKYCDSLKRILRIAKFLQIVLEYPHTINEPMINLDQKYESYVRNGSKKLRIDGIEERVRAYGYTDDGKDIDGYYLITDNYTLYYNTNEQFIRMEALAETTVAQGGPLKCPYSVLRAVCARKSQRWRIPPSKAMQRRCRG